MFRLLQLGVREGGGGSALLPSVQRARRAEAFPLSEGSGEGRTDGRTEDGGGAAGAAAAFGVRSKMAVQESAAQLSMTLKVQEYPTLKVGGRCLGLRGPFRHPCHAGLRGGASSAEASPLRWWWGS